jgi:hypothetical protein
MVGRHDEEEGFYEVGIMPAPMHAFKISIQENGPMAQYQPGLNGVCSYEMVFDHIPDSARFWKIGIEDSDPDFEVYEADWEFDRQIPAGELSDEQKADFRWIIDLEKEFVDHGTIVPLRRGLLWPIVRINNGTLRCLEIGKNFLETIQPGHSHHSSVDFGYACETAEITMQVDDYKDVILKVMQEEESEEETGTILRLKVVPNKEFIIKIQNIPIHQENESSSQKHESEYQARTHFQLFYMLMSVSPYNWYDFIIGGKDEPEEKAALRALEALPSFRAGTPNPYKCGIGHLGNRSQPLS